MFEKNAILNYQTSSSSHIGVVRRHIQDPNFYTLSQVPDARPTFARFPVVRYFRQRINIMMTPQPQRKVEKGIKL